MYDPSVVHSLPISHVEPLVLCAGGCQCSDVAGKVELRTLDGIFRQDTALSSRGLRPREVCVVDEVHASTAADLRRVVVAPVVDHVVNPTCQPGNAISVVGKKAVVNGNAVGRISHQRPGATTK